MAGYRDLTGAHAEITETLIREAVSEIEFTTVVERLFDHRIDDPGDDIAQAILDATQNATLTVTIT